MRRFSASLVILLSMSLIGCGGGDTGPADPSDIPEVDEAAIQESMSSGMPEDMKKKYGVE